jgi:hypothetical protein
VAIRFGRLLSALVLLGVVATGVSLALTGSTDTVHRTSNVCLTTAITRVREHADYCPVRTAQLHCHCCGRDENGHCNHQCCD